VAALYADKSGCDVFRCQCGSGYGKTGEGAVRHYCGWLYHSLSAVNVRVAVNCLVEQLLYDDIAVTRISNCDSLTVFLVL
jgi:hypothetical protein